MRLLAPLLTCVLLGSLLVVLEAVISSLTPGVIPEFDEPAIVLAFDCCCGGGSISPFAEEIALVVTAARLSCVRASAAAFLFARSTGADMAARGTELRTNCSSERDRSSGCSRCSSTSWAVCFRTAVRLTFPVDGLVRAWDVLMFLGSGDDVITSLSTDWRREDDAITNGDCLTVFGCCCCC